MSTNVSTEAARDALRREHGVRLVTSDEEGSAAMDLPAGVYGFTASPILASPLFANRRYRNFEVHRLASGVVLVGFVTAADAAQLSHQAADIVTLKIYADAETDATSIVAISYDQIVQHRQYAVRNADAVSLQVVSAHALTS